MGFDLVIPVGPKDEELVKKNILCNKKRITGYRNKHDERVMKNVMMNV